MRKNDIVDISTIKRIADTIVSGIIKEIKVGKGKPKPRPINLPKPKPKPAPKPGRGNGRSNRTTRKVPKKFF